MIHKIINIIGQQLGLAGREITPESTFEELYIDSLDRVEIVMALEDELNIEISDEVCAEWKSVKDVIEGVRNVTLV